MIDWLINSSPSNLSLQLSDGSSLGVHLDVLALTSPHVLGHAIQLLKGKQLQQEEQSSLKVSSGGGRWAGYSAWTLLIQRALLWSLVLSRYRMVMCTL